MWKNIVNFFFFFNYYILKKKKRKINLPRYHDSGRLRGYGHVCFKTKKGLTKALEKNQEYLGNRYIRVELANPIDEKAEDE